ncbi:Exosome complex component Rrp4 [uncultured archaeon]|nr:Exosome complex component Rrp4 [uncultured archaeon]
MEERKIVVPGETIIQGEEFLPGDGTRREDKDVVANRYGLAEVSDKLVRVIPLSGVYTPRRGNVIIGKIVNMNYRGWVVDFGTHNNGFLNVAEYPRFINKGELKEYLTFGDVICAKVFSADDTSVDLSVKLRGFGRLNGGQLITINPNKVPRVIGKEGSMVHLIKAATGCEITVGQNGIIWVKSSKVEDELNAKKIINFISENSFVSGLTEKVEEYIKKDLKLEIKDIPKPEPFVEPEFREERNFRDDRGFRGGFRGDRQ